ncbi:MAG: hypothetical protein ACUVSX_07540 [Aggregatilineales bacterium]
MRQLVIEYVLEGHRRGYNFTSPTAGFADEVLRTVWRSAMPRGQGWNAPAYVGARALKSFLVGDFVAVSQVTVTDQRDDSGRGGIRRAVVDVMTFSEYTAYLHERLRAYPPDVQAALERLPTLAQRARIMNRAMKQSKQLVLAQAYDGPRAWQVVEGLVIKLALSPFPPVPRNGRIVPFTTLALDHRDESALVALPAARARQLKGAPVVYL